MIPTFEFSMELPPMMVKSDRLHNQLVKRVIKLIAYDHWKKRIKKHFEPSAHSTYGYAKRQKGYSIMKAKSGHGTTDLVFSGKSKQEMTSHHKITVGGGGKNAINAKLLLRFAFVGGSGRFKEGKNLTSQALKIRQMRQEIQKMTDQEIREMARDAGTLYTRFVNDPRVVGPRQRVDLNNFQNVLFEDSSPYL